MPIIPSALPTWGEAELAVAMKDKELHKKYKGLSTAVVKEAFGWNDQFVTPEPQARGTTSGALSQ